jgi:DNA-binding NarL/FixJ family response regulator
MRICLFDDDFRIHESFSNLMDSTGELEICGMFSDAEHIEQKLDKCKPDLVLMDVMMPDINGIEAVKRAKRHMPDLPILMYTVSDDDDAVFQSICAGAVGYILKSSSYKKILDSINDVMEGNGGGCMSPIIARKVMNYYKNHQLGLRSPDYHLTSREMEVLTLMTEGLIEKEIAEKIFVSKNTVHSHIKSIYQKLQVSSNIQAVSKAFKEGIMSKSK